MYFPALICYTSLMTKLLKVAIDALSRLSEDEQECAARAILDFAAHDGDDRFGDGQVEEVERC